MTVRQWTIKELNDVHPLPDQWRWEWWGQGLGWTAARLNEHGAPVERVGVKPIADGGGLDATTLAPHLDVCLAVILASKGLDSLGAMADENKRLRTRVRVERDDVTRAGVTRADVVAFLEAQGWVRSGENSWGHAWGIGEMWRPALYDPRGVTVYEQDDQDPVAKAIGTIAYHLGKPSLDILDECAAMLRRGKTQP